MGAQQIVNMDSHRGGVSFLVGTEKAHVLILKPEDLTKRNTIIDAVLSLSTLRNLYQLVYLAAPRLLGASIDASVFRTSGIGLLFFDERRIDEAVAPQPMQLGPANVASPLEENAVVAELATLKTMYREMERTLNQLRDDLKTLYQAPRGREEPPRLSEPVQTVAAQPLFSQTVTQSVGLPSYFTNNPWLEVLSKRGSGEHEPIAA
jgi:hypothetical protein